MAVKLHPSIDKGLKAGAKKFKGGTLTCHCAADPVTVSIKGNVAHNHACGCTKCWKPAGAKFSVVAVVSRDNLSVTANEQKLTTVDASAAIQRHACSGCGVHMYGRIENTEPSVLRSRLRARGAVEGEGLGQAGIRGVRVVHHRSGRRQAQGDDQDPRSPQEAAPPALRLPVAAAHGCDRHACREGRRARSRSDRPIDILATISQHACFGGVLGYYQHPSRTNNCDMRFAVYAPPQAAAGPVPVLYYLAGLTCTEETFVTKAGALEHAARHGIMLVAPDTSPRVQLPGDRESWDFGIAAGFYLDATQAPWATHYRMYSYVVDELPQVIAANFKADISRSGIMGHSMGGHGALTIALKNPQKYKSLSAFAPIAAPIQSPWGNKAFTGYLGAYRAAWSQYDATELVKAGHRFAGWHPHRPGHRRTNSSPSSSSPICWWRRARQRGRKSTCRCARATTTATSSSRASSRST